MTTPEEKCQSLIYNLAVQVNTSKTLPSTFFIRELQDVIVKCDARVNAIISPINKVIQDDLGVDIWNRIQQYKNTTKDNQYANQVWGRYKRLTHTTLPRALDFRHRLKYCIS